MESLVKLETALLENNSESVSDYLSEIDQRTANAAMKEAGEAFGFPTVLANRTVWTSMGMLAQIFGYTSTNGVGNLIEKYQLTTSKIGWFPFQMGSKMRATFNLSEKDSKAIFVTWDTFLVLGMCGRGERADKVKLYLLKAERAFRIGIAKDAGLSITKADTARLKLVKEEVGLMGMIGKMKPGEFQLAAIEAFEKVTGKTYPGPKQLVLNFLKKEAVE
jgi:hypothetical protein